MRESDEQSFIEQLDAGDRVFRAGTAEVSIRPRALWITVRHRGGTVMMSLDEAEQVIAVIRAASEYARGDGHIVVSSEPDRP